MHTDVGTGEGNAKGTEEETGRGWGGRGERPEPCAAAMTGDGGTGGGRAGNARATDTGGVLQPLTTNERESRSDRE